MPAVYVTAIFFHECSSFFFALMAEDRTVLTKRIKRLLADCPLSVLQDFEK